MNQLLSISIPLKLSLQPCKRKTTQLATMHSNCRGLSVCVYSVLPERCSPVAVCSPLRLFPDSSAVCHCSYCILSEWFVPRDKWAAIMSNETQRDRAKEEEKVEQQREEDLNVKTQR